MLKKAKTFPLRLPVSLRKQSSELAAMEGISLNQFISIALAEKIGRMEELVRVKTSNNK